MKNDFTIKFSIIIPTYNREDFILNTLDSVFSQTYKNFEVIVVDNCSTDKTVELLKPLAENNKIRLIQHDKNYERSKSRNTGMKNATGDFLTFLDSDDFMYPSNLADAAEFIEKNPQVHCFHNLYELIDSKGNIIYKHEFPSLDNPIKAIVSGNFMGCIGNFVSREVYEKIYFDTYKELTGAEDWDYWLRVIGDYGVSRINKINNGMLHHEQQTVQSNKHYEELEKGYLYMFDKYNKDEHLNKIFGKHIDRIKANSYIYLASLANTNGHFEKAREYLKIAINSDSSVFLSKRFAFVMGRALLKKRPK